MKRTAVLMAVMCLVALAATGEARSENREARAQSDAANRQSAVVGHRSSVVGGAEAIAIPQLLSYQGRLTDTLGVPVADTLYAIRFRLYAVPSGGTQFWEETQDVRTKGGLFSVLLGSVTPIGTVPDAGTLYLGMAVEGGAELSPRLRIGSAAYAYLSARAADADLLQGKDTSAFDTRYVNESQANSVTSGMIVNGTIAAADLGQMGAATGQVMKWSGSAWTPRNDSVGGGGGGTVRKVVQAAGVVCSPNPITDSGTVRFDSAWGHARYVNVSGDSMTGALAVQGDLRVYGKGRIGPSNSNAGTGAFVVGQANAVDGVYASVTGGEDNEASGTHAHVGGGGENQASGSFSCVGGGEMNYATGLYGVATGGRDNTATGHAATVAGGRANTAGDEAADTSATVAGGYRNFASAMCATVGGGQNDTASGRWSTVGGGKGNAASHTYALVSGGLNNKASGFVAAVGGGQLNTATGDEATVGGGLTNEATGGQATVGGGEGNEATGRYAAVGGGYNNDADGTYATVGGGYYNSADTSRATVGGGHMNSASGYAAVVCGGSSNQATGEDAAVVGGLGNEATGGSAAVGGGYGNAAGGFGATVAGGRQNAAETSYATVGGGYQNTASAAYATVPGGGFNDARGSYSLAAGRFARANHRGSFVWSDSAVSVSESVYTSGNNQFRARARGGTWFFSNAGMTTGAYLASGSNSWESACDSMTKEDFRPVDRKTLLDKVAALRVRDYKMKDQNDGTRHIGPVAQDFHNAFGYGGNETSINMADADGVLMAAVQALYERLEAQQAEIEALKAELRRR